MTSEELHGIAPHCTHAKDGVSENEAWYDAEIAPALMELARQCEARKVPLIGVYVTRLSIDPEHDMSPEVTAIPMGLIRCLRGHETRDLSFWGMECRECRIETLEAELVKLRALLGKALLGRAVRTKYGTGIVSQKRGEVFVEFADGSGCSLHEIEAC